MDTTTLLAILGLFLTAILQGYNLYLTHSKILPTIVANGNHPLTVTLPVVVAPNTPIEALKIVVASSTTPPPIL